MPLSGQHCKFLDNLHVKKEELATIGVIIKYEDYHSTILLSLPASLANFASMQLAAACMFSFTKTIPPDVDTLSAAYMVQGAHKNQNNMLICVCDLLQPKAEKCEGFRCLGLRQGDSV